MFLPYATSELTYRRPWANYALLAATAVAFFAFGGFDHYAVARSARDFGVGGDSALGPVSYLFVHADLAHLIGNLLALWLFGNSICARVGNLAYVPLYLVLGALSGLTQQLFHDGYTIGASGAINGLIAMFLAITPRARISILLGWLFPPLLRTWTVRSYWVIGLWVLFDVIGALSSHGPVAYGAHLGGYLFGLLVALAGLRLRAIPTDDDDRTLPDLFGWSWRRKTAVAAPSTQPLAATVASGEAAPRKATPAPARRPAAPRPAPAPVLHRAAPAPDGLRRDPQFVELTCACGERVEASRLFGLEGLRCPGCGAPLEPA